MQLRQLPWSQAGVRAITGTVEPDSSTLELPPTGNLDGRQPVSRMMRAMLQLRAEPVVVATIAVLTGAAALAGCSGQQPDGTVAGTMPVCFGPGPHDNLSPSTGLYVYRHGKVVDSPTFVTNDRLHFYRLTLPAGTYSLAVHGGRAVRTTIEQGHSTHGPDVPGLACL
jgi:hypothetical protein